MFLIWCGFRQYVKYIPGTFFRHSQIKYDLLRHTYVCIACSGSFKVLKNLSQKAFDAFTTPV
jgi:hypothetical protein